MTKNQRSRIANAFSLAWGKLKVSAATHNVPFAFDDTVRINIRNHGVEILANNNKYSCAYGSKDVTVNSDTTDWGSSVTITGGYKSWNALMDSRNCVG